MAQTKYLTVSALTKYIKRKFDFDPYLQDFYLKGEISNLKKHSSGHLYFTLKDDQARLLAIMFASQARTMPFTPENGMSVLVRGGISVYEANGQYQMYVKEMKPDGVGSLFLAYEQLKEKLEKEGLFSQARKKKIPLFPETVGVVTSPTGAAVRDIITTIQRRFPIGKVILFPALVQGEQAPASIVEAIEKAKIFGTIDVLIVGRGGGSIEELWAFNDEKVARAIVSSPIPIISAVGHETDFTISDFVADLRAPTPTGAAELAVPLLEDLYQRIDERKLRLSRAIGNKLRVERIHLKKLSNSYALRSPKRLYVQKLEKMDRLHESLNREMRRLIRINQDKRMIIQNRLSRSAPIEIIKSKRIEREGLQKNLQKNMFVRLEKKKQSFSGILQTLHALNPLSIMERGYSVTYSESGKIIKSIHSAEKGETISVTVKDGTLLCEIHDKKENTGHEERS
ncbi:exodeoxyribonuclease VII large subunit [Bacillus oleivorans]|uniref:Exodeoxyribonuclease 7 large subunit n=1 Tax=Bacillus oleivorans TaxID=1448271 RepID=A0A285CK62_9BACI|nr:exodeoxyribonuclease VII large subunit [Bacillus oleivorans]SNX67974.1 exodeoxyribonuclease VII large subunit [Bacillus oleivorans]